MFSSPSYGRWANIKEAAWTSKNTVEFYVKKNGTYTEKSSFQSTIANERGKFLGTRALYYKPSSEKVQIIDALTKNGKIAIPVEKSQIEDKLVASSSLQGFDATNQITINFPQIKVGSTVSFKYEKEVKEVSISNFWSVRFAPWEDEPILKGSSISITSELPLLYEIKSFKTKFKDQLLITSKQENGKYFLKIEVKEDIYYQTLEENYPYVAETIPYLTIASTDKFTEKLTPIVSLYDKVISKDFPKELQKIFEKAKKEKGLITRAELIMRELDDKIRYSGDWRTVHGAYIPRPLSEVFKSQYGDCKDYTASLVAVLRKLGYNSYPAWIYRGREASYHRFGKLPSDSFMNHAIVYVKNKGKSYWFDPTNTFSYAKGPQVDIANRPAVVLHPKKPFIENVPTVSFEEAKYKSLIEISYGNKTSIIKNTRNYYGVEAVSLANSLFSLSKEQVKHNLTKRISGENEILETLDFKISQDFEKNQIIDKPIKVETKLKLRDKPEKTTAGDSFSVGNHFSFFTNLHPKEYECSGINIGSIGVDERKIIIKNKEMITLDQKEFISEVKSPWGNYKRTIKQEGKDIVIVHKTKIFKSYLTNKEIHSKEFKVFRQKLLDNFDRLALIFKAI